MRKIFFVVAFAVIAVVMLGFFIRGTVIDAPDFGTPPLWDGSF